MQSIQNTNVIKDKHNKDKHNKTGIVLENITSTAGYNQTINKPTHFTNVSSSCINLIFASNTTYLTTGTEQMSS